MIRCPPRSTRTDTLFPYTTYFRALGDPRLASLGKGVGWPLRRQPYGPDGAPWDGPRRGAGDGAPGRPVAAEGRAAALFAAAERRGRDHRDRKSTRLNSSH